MNLQLRRDPYKLIGTTLDRYQIQELVGIGGMGAVYRAQHEITKATVAIKILRPDLTLSDHEGVGLFFEEATKTVSLNHPSIIRVTNADYTADGWAYMVMEWLEGRTLDAEMKEHGVLSLQRTNLILEQVAEAVAYAHQKGVIHRDLKPSNIMVVSEENGEERIRVLDFGIAKVLSTTVGTNTRIAGTSYYISPEQTIAHSPIDQSTDIYSLGVILYQMLTGQVPFEADTEGQVMDMHRTIAPKPLREIRPSVPQAVEEVVLKAIAKKPADRFPTAIDLARAFRAATNLASSVMVVQCMDAQTEAPVFLAEIYLNGKRAGQSDEGGWWREKKMIPRQYLIEVESTRYVRWHQSIELGAREELTVTAKLERKQQGEMVVACNVANVEVKIDGEVAGRTDQNGRFYLQSIAAGTHTVKLVHPRYVPSESQVQIEVWGQAYAPFQLTEYPRRDLIKLASRKLKTLSELQLGRRFGEMTKRLVSRPASTRSASSTPRPKADSYSRRSGVTGSLKACSRCGEPIRNEIAFCTQCGFYLGPVIEAEIVDSERPGKVQFEVEPLPPPPDLKRRPERRSGRLPENLPESQPENPPGSQPENPPERLPERFEDPLDDPLDDPGMTRTVPMVIHRRPRTRRSFRMRRLARTVLWASLGTVVVLLMAVSVYTIFFRNPKPGPTVRIVDPVPSPTAEPASEKAVPPPPPGMVFIPGGTFTMGYGEAAPDNPSGPEHEVTVNPYFIDKFEVTRAAYSPRRNLAGEAGQLPATNLTWREARDYCQRIGKRLPTEDEWEFAARGSDRRIYPWGNRFEPNRANVGSQRLAPVGSFPAGDSPFGLSDMSGNALEWTDSYFTNYSGSLYQRRQCKEPCRVIRGGAYFDDPKDATVVFRREYEPTTLNRVKNAYAVLGFRCAQDATPR